VIDANGGSGPRQLPVLEDVHREGAPADGQPDNASRATRRSRRSVPSQIALLRELKAEGFFGEPKTMGQVVDRLKDKGHIVKQNSISGRFQELTKTNELYRQQGADGFVYKDSPFTP
jgi:hypothetical protein